MLDNFTTLAFILFSFSLLLLTPKPFIPPQIFFICYAIFNDYIGKCNSALNHWVDLLCESSAPHNELSKIYHFSFLLSTAAMMITSTIPCLSASMGFLMVNLYDRNRTHFIT